MTRLHKSVRRGLVAAISWILHDEFRTSAVSCAKDVRHACDDLVRALELPLVSTRHIGKAFNVLAVTDNRRATVARVAGVHEDRKTVGEGKSVELGGRRVTHTKITPLLIADVRPDYVGAVGPDEFVVGYGMDWGGKLRSLPFVGVVKPELYM